MGNLYITVTSEKTECIPVSKKSWNCE